MELTAKLKRVPFPVVPAAPEAATDGGSSREKHYRFESDREKIYNQLSGEEVDPEKAAKNTK